VGVAVGTGVGLLGMPNPMLWGALACVLTYVPYLGAAVGIGVLAFASVLTFDDLGRALAVPAVYVVVSFLEGNFVTPAVLGQRLTLNPVVIFIGLLFWFFLWGIPGALLAVPTIVIFKIVCDHVEGLAAIGEFFGPKDES
ncbi:MAG TPA: AI-2E family transporter, partial [Vicinamibacteria bacterium]|nr:AI-2E family transporter [Vicinamibacteria bacterium]